jgi:seryl-tRNA synthetase
VTMPLQPGADHNQQAATFRLALLQAGLMVSSGANEILGYSAEFETLVEAAGAYIGGLFADMAPEVLRFPVLMSRGILEKSRYIEGFPQLAGMVHCFCGSTDEHKRMLSCIAEGADWAQYQTPADVALTPASCYPVYPLIASRGPVGEAGCLIDVSSYCFRHEPSIDPIRLQMFRQRELVFVGQPEAVADFIELWLDRATAGLRALSLDVNPDIANDAFFGRFKEMMVSTQRSQRLKTELLVPISNLQQPSACGSCNNHKNHFAAAFGIRQAGGELAYTACAGFGLERLALALLRRHGLVPQEWPAALRQRLCLDQ